MFYNFFITFLLLRFKYDDCKATCHDKTKYHFKIRSLVTLYFLLLEEKGFTGVMILA